MNQRKRPAFALACKAFAAALLAGLLLTAYIDHSRLQQERDRMGYIASSLGSETYEFMLSEMSKTRVLEAYLRQTGGSYEGFEKIADILLREEYVRNVLFAPDGIVEGVFPLEGNEAVIGLNMYEDGAGNREAQAAIEKRRCTSRAPLS